MRARSRTGRSCYLVCSLLLVGALTRMPAAAADPLEDVTSEAGETAGEVAGDVGDVVDDTAGGAGQALGDATGGATDPITGPVGDAVGDVTDTVGDTVDEVGDTVEDTVDEAEDTVEETVDEVEDAVEEVEDTVEDGTGGITDPVTDPEPDPGPEDGSPSGRAEAAGNDGGTSGPAPTGGQDTPSAGSSGPLPGSGADRAAASEADRLARAPSSEPLRGATPGDHARTEPQIDADPITRIVGDLARELAGTDDGAGLLESLRRIAVEAARHAAFPLLLALLVAGFVAVQGHVDNKDPKLAEAPLDAQQDLLSFK